jgi:hypothetical protein
MKPHGTYKIRNQRRVPWPAAPSDDEFEALPRPVRPHASSEADLFLARLARSEHRVRRILDSLRSEIVGAGGTPSLRIRRIFQTPREIYRLELALPELGYQRTTLLDRDALEELLEADDVRAVVETALDA